MHGSLLCLPVALCCIFPIDEPKSPLVGSWEREGNINTFSSDGSGKNHDGSGFRWEFKDDRLIARAQLPDGKLGEDWSTLVAFTKDKKEYSYLLGDENGGRTRITFYKLDDHKHHFKNRSDADRAYPADSEALKDETRAEDPSTRPLPIK